VLNYIYYIYFVHNYCEGYIDTIRIVNDKTLFWGSSNSVDQ